MVEINSQISGINTKYFQKIAEKLMRKEKISGKMLSITFTTSGFIKELNHKYRKKNRSTDVITFYFDDDEQVFGDIYISVDDARGNLELRNHSLKSELTFLLVHGFVHLLGYDHQNDDQQQHMKNKENELMWYINRNKFNVLRNFVNAMDGIRYATDHEKAFRAHILLLIITVTISYFLNLTRVEWLFVATAITFMLVSELLNTSIEKIADLVTEDYNQLIKAIKDMCSGAVMISVIYALIVASLVLLPRGLQWFI